MSLGVGLVALKLDVRADGVEQDSGDDIPGSRVFCPFHIEQQLVG